ncbi:MAG: serine hydrolase domain-containing protein, partial [Bryobacteraceae bacterium]
MRPAILAGFVCAGVLSAQIQFTAGPALDAAIEQAVKDDQIPGAVLMIGHNGQIVYQKAYGYRALVPRKEAMTMDTIFDAASLTKVVATTSCVMKLVEEGKLRLADKVTQYLPEYQAGRS